MCANKKDPNMADGAGKGQGGGGEEGALGVPPSLPSSLSLPPPTPSLLLHPCWGEVRRVRGEGRAQPPPRKAPPLCKPGRQA